MDAERRDDKYWTAERVDQVIREQMRKLPKWWAGAARREMERTPRAPAHKQPVRLLTRGRKVRGE